MNSFFVFLSDNINLKRLVNKTDCSLASIYRKVIVILVGNYLFIFNIYRDNDQSSISCYRSVLTCSLMKQIYM